MEDFMLGMAGDDLTIVLFLIGTAISIACAAMHMAGWRHPLLIGGLFSLAGVCLFIGVAWPALKTILPPATAIVDQIATNPVAWFSILILGVAASIFLPRRRDKISSTIEPPVATKISHVSAPTPEILAVKAAPTVPQRKVFVNVSPSYLMDLYNERTTVPGDALAAAYIGKWITTTISVRY
jgi:hypothetical protein